jgi:hypothetical protein
VAQAIALKKIYRGPRDPKNGEQIFPGYEATMEAAAGRYGGWRGWLAHEDPTKALQFVFANQFFSHLVFDDPNWIFTGST